MRADPRWQALESLLSLPAAELRPTLNTVSQVISELLHADKVDVFLIERSTQCLVAVGTSETPMGRLQQALGLDRMPLANGGRAVQAYETEKPFMTGRQEEDPEELPGIKFRLGVRSSLMVPLPIGEEIRGVLGVSSAKNDFFTREDLRFLSAVARWVGMVAHRVELAQELTKLGVKQAQRRPEGLWARFAIMDQGPGIPPSSCPRSSSASREAPAPRGWASACTSRGASWKRTAAPWKWTRSRAWARASNWRCRKHPHPPGSAAAGQAPEQRCSGERWPPHRSLNPCSPNGCPRGPDSRARPAPARGHPACPGRGPLPRTPPGPG